MAVKRDVDREIQEAAEAGWRRILPDIPFLSGPIVPGTSAASREAARAMMAKMLQLQRERKLGEGQ